MASKSPLKEDAVHIETKQAIHDIFHSTYKEVTRPSKRQDQHRTEQIMTELSLLRQLKPNNHIISLHRVDILYDNNDQNARSFNSLQLTYISSKNNRRLSEIFESDQYFSAVEIKYILFQIITTVKYLHSINIIHRNLNPQTILIDEHLFVQISDFYHAVQKRENLKYRSDPKRKSRAYFFDKGSEIENDESKKNEMLREFLGPKIMREHEMGYRASYSHPCLDVWSIGMIFTILLQMNEDIISDLTQRKSLMHRLQDVAIRSYVEGLKNIGGAPMLRVLCFHRLLAVVETLIKKYAKALDLSRQMLFFRRRERAKMKQLMKHSYFDEIRQRCEEWGTYKPRHVDWRWKYHFDWDVVDANNMKKSRRECILEEVLRYNPNEKMKLLKGMTFASAELQIDGFCRLYVPGFHVVNGIKRIVRYYLFCCDD